MHIPLITTLATRLLPFSSPQSALTAPDPPSSSLTFRPIHAHSHFFNSTTPPQLLLHNASSSTGISAYRSMAHEDNFDELLGDSPLLLRTRRMTIRRPKIPPPTMISWAVAAQYHRRRRQNLVGDDVTLAWDAPDFNDEDGNWEDIEIDGPDVSDRQTLITLAKMTSNAYVLPDSGEWWPVGDWNATIPFGWEADSDGLRGHVFADPTNSTVVISIKGTSAGLLGGGGPTAKNDKFNDNLLFSCCCARVDFSWSPVCDCYAGGYRCEQTCLEDALVAESVYATVGTNLYNNVTYMYPNATIWLVGHSLGGSVGAMIGLSFGAAAVSFEAPGDLLPAKRLHLPLPPGMPADKTGITHVYHTADPIPMGACTGAYSGCYAAGFAMESKCHTGQTILYDTVTVKGWSVDVRTHRIGEIINKVLADPWPTEENSTSIVRHHAGLRVVEENEDGGWFTKWRWWGRKGPKPGQPIPGEGDGDDWEKHGGVPKQKSEEDCQDCFRWEFGDNWNNKTKKVSFN